jgi:hypothetical protein
VKKSVHCARRLKCQSRLAINAKDTTPAMRISRAGARREGRRSACRRRLLPAPPSVAAAAFRRVSVTFRPPRFPMRSQDHRSGAAALQLGQWTPRPAV